MGVAVQLMVDAEVSGVMFTCNPVSGDPSMVAVNASWGLGLAVVGGEVTPDDYLVSKVTRRGRARARPREGRRVRARRRRPRRRPCRRAGGAARDRVPRRGALDALVELGRRIERYFGSHQDVEWAIARGRELPASSSSSSRGR